MKKLLKIFTAFILVFSILVPVNTVKAEEDDDNTFVVGMECTV